jgi:hypothetical protein
VSRVRRSCHVMPLLKGMLGHAPCSSNMFSCSSAMCECLVLVNQQPQRQQQQQQCLGPSLLAPWERHYTLPISLVPFPALLTVIVAPRR